MVRNPRCTCRLYKLNQVGCLKTASLCSLESSLPFVKDESTRTSAVTHFVRLGVICSSASLPSRSDDWVACKVNQVTFSVLC
jgi:hypothetical protein